MQFRNNNFIHHLVYAFSFLLAVLAFIGYQVWDKYHTETLMERKIEQQKIERQNELMQRAEQEKIRKIKILECLKITDEASRKDWAAACAEQARGTKNTLDNCINQAATFAKAGIYMSEDQNNNLYLFGVAQCKRLYGTPNSKPNCLLPTSIADGIKAEQKKYEKLCFAMG